MLQFPKIPQVSKFTDQIKKIENLATILEHIPLNIEQKQYVFHQETLKSSLFSAKIEGNTLTLEDISKTDLTNPKTKKKQEISNVLNALQKLMTIKLPLSKETILQLHQIAMKSLRTDAGKIRSDSSAIFDQHGNIAYLTPSPTELNKMLKIFIKQLNIQPTLSLSDQLILIPACHYYFEKIHPFIDGNGRVGRLLVHYQLGITKLSSDYILPIDQYFNQHKSEYYYHLEKNTRNINDFITFFLEGVVWSFETILDDIKKLATEPPSLDGKTTLLRSQLPRRQEIYSIIIDHPYISLDSIARRFPTIPRRSIAHDVNQLIKINLVNKHGQTKGVVYTAEEV